MSDPLEDHVANLFADPDTETSEAPAEESAESAAPEQPESAPEPSQTALPDTTDWSRIAQARLREINALRTRYSDTRDRLSDLEKRFQALSSRLEPGEELPEELLQADPALRFVTGKLKGIEQRLQTSQQAQEEQARFSQETQETVRYAQESRQAFVQHTPDWDQAYQFVRERFARANGKTGAPDKDEWLNVQEHIAVSQWRNDGEDPALKIYEMAVASGWRPGQNVGQNPAQITAPTNGTPRTRRIRDAVAAPSPASIGTRDLGRDVLSREQFYEQFPQGERIRIFNSERGEDIFESLMKEGRVPVSMLPRST